MCKGRIVRFLLCKIQVEVDECCHKVGLARTHRKAEYIVWVVHSIEDTIEDAVKIYILRLLHHSLAQSIGNRFPFLVLQRSKLIECHSGRRFFEYSACYGRQLHIIYVIVGESIELALLKKNCKRQVLTFNLQIQVRLDGIHLCITHLTLLLNVSYERQGRTICVRKPFIALVCDYIVEHLFYLLILFVYEGLLAYLPMTFLASCYFFYRHYFSVSLSRSFTFTSKAMAILSKVCRSG